MNEELQKLIDVVMEPLQRFHFERKRIMVTVLTEDSDDLLDDPFANAGLEGVYRELRRREIYRRAQTQWLARNLIHLLSRPESEESSCLSKSEAEATETGADSLTGQFQQTHHHNLL
jgi:hypothetical protein